MQGVELVGDDEVDFAAFGGLGKLVGHFGGGAEFRAAVDDGDAGGDVLEGDGPVDRGIAAAGDDDAFVAEGLAFFDVVLDRAGGLVGGDAVERGAVGAEGAGTGGDDDGFGGDGVVLVGGDGEGAGGAGDGGDDAAEQARRGEGFDLAFEVFDQGGGFDRGVGGDVVDRFFRVEGGALAADFGQRVDQHRGEFEHAAFEGGEEADRAGADDGHIGHEGI